MEIRETPELTELVLMLTKEDPDFRGSTIFTMDGAKYHTSAETTEFLLRLKLTVAISSSKSPHLAPIEMSYAHLKSGDLNRYNHKVTKK